MIESIEFTNFKALRKTSLPLAPSTLVLGPNGSGKSSVLRILHEIAVTATESAGIQKAPVVPQARMDWSALRSVTVNDERAGVEIQLRLRIDSEIVFATFNWQQSGPHVSLSRADGSVIQLPRREILHDDVPGTDIRKPHLWNLVFSWLSRMQLFALDAATIALPVQVGAGPILAPNGSGLAAVLDDLKDNQPERWATLLAEMREWLPEYDYILFDKPQQGQKGIVLRTKKGGHRIPAAALSQGTLVALALLTLAYLPNPPSLVDLEEIDRGLHPRLLRHLQDALYRLSYPESCGETRPPIQVIAITHSPYLLDLYREHPEEVVLAQKQGLEVSMKRLTDIEHYQEILGESPLSEMWYSGVLGGVSVKP